ncbi:iron-sulfur cluster assembly accessory protein [bacterium]|nr:iron-sulfur cluster assembly accessory protein [bacterium]
MTVVARSGSTVYVGRCDRRDERTIVLLGADEHTEGVDPGTNLDYLAKAARYGFWTKHDRLVLPTSEVEELSTLSSHIRGDGQTVFRAETAVGVASAAESSEADLPAASPVILTEGARREVVRLLREQQDDAHGLRLAVSGGGCSGLVYRTDFDVRREGDVVIRDDGFDIYMDPKSLIYLRGITLDFQGGLNGRGFRFANPNASNTCGCGESFAV